MLSSSPDIAAAPLITTERSLAEEADVDRGGPRGRPPGALWGARAAAWAEEEAEAAKFEEPLARAEIGPGRAVLDVGCGSACSSAGGRREARVAGLDASEALLAIARRRVPEADLRVGDMGRLPFDDDAFDAVTGFNSFFLAPDMTEAVREAGRVARPGAPVVIQVWGRPERVALTPMFAALRGLRGAPPPGPRWRGQARSRRSPRRRA